jgi:anti-sigma B factor antagonist
MTLNIDIKGDGHRRILKLEGECDIGTAPALREALRPLIPPEVTDLRVDVYDLDFIDSTGLGVIVGALRRIREGGGELTLAGARGAVQRVLEVTRLDQAIPLA